MRRDPNAIHQCERCPWRGTWDQHAMNPRQGYKVCPRCWHQGYDCLTYEVKPTEPTDAK